MTRTEVLRILDWHESADQSESGLLARIMRVAEAAAAAERERLCAPQKPAMWVHRDNPQLTTTRQPLGSDWEPLYRRPAPTLLDPRGSLGELIV